jgi:UDP-N-acetylmuramate dehydrogenase
MQISKDISLKNFHSFRVETKAKYLCIINNLNDLNNSIDFAKRNRIPYIFLGNGNNVLFVQEYEGLVIINNLKGINITSETNDSIQIEAASGEDWPELVDYCVYNNWSGIENLSLIPGTAGAAPIQNIGAYGVEIKDVITNIKAYELQNRRLVNIDTEECNFGYRTSIFKTSAKGKYFITSITLNLKKHFTPNISYKPLNEYLNNKSDNISLVDVNEAVKKIRNSKLPDPKILGNAGSFFKNPTVSSNIFYSLQKKYPDIPAFITKEGNHKLAAAWLIEKSGWKGKRIGAAGIHEKQPLVIVNYGNATGKEILHLATKVKDSVYENFKINLEFEVNII